MEYKHSTVVDPSTYDDFGLCGALPLRISKYGNLADKGCQRAQEDWIRFVGKISDFTGCRCARFNAISAGVPECHPERMEMVTYANEFAFLQDDVTDTASEEKSFKENDEFSVGFRVDAETGFTSSVSGKSQMQAKMILELMSIDRERAILLVKCWEQLVNAGASGAKDREFLALDDYIPWRIVNVGEPFWFGILSYGMELTITEEERKLIMPITAPAFVSLALTNDFFSWQKEYDQFKREAKAPYMVNAIWILMQEHSIDIERAKQMLKDKIAGYCQEYLRLTTEFRSSKVVSLDVQRYLSALELSIAGNVGWSQFTPRYNFATDSPKKAVNGLQNGLHSRKNGANGQYSAVESHVNEDEQSQTGLLSPPISSVCGKCRDQMMTGPEDQVQEFSSFPPSEVDPGEKDMVPKILSKVLLAPFQYISSLPSKGVRNATVDALNLWIGAPEECLAVIKSVVNLLHNSSLMLDDMQDCSSLRRGRPSTHTVFGLAWTMNSADYLFVAALQELQKLDNPKCLTVFIGKLRRPRITFIDLTGNVEELRYLYVGQSYDLYWTRNVSCPSVEDYLRMVDQKTGGLFRMIARLMAAVSKNNRIIDLSGLVTLVGRYFQIRDDYQNLVSPDYTQQKGFCEDLDEGKFSLPLIHTIQNSSHKVQLLSILQERRAGGKLSFELKQVILEHMSQTKSLDYAKACLDTLHDEINGELRAIEKDFAAENYILKLLLERLRV